jgi:two-component system, cell cycle response regulator
MPTSDFPTRVTGAIKNKAVRPVRAQSACLVQYTGDAVGRRYLLTSSELVIGRAPSSSIVLADDSVSREHAKCVVVDQGIEIEDLGSSNGTFINEVRIARRAKLRDGDLVQVGVILLKYFAHDSIENVFHDALFRKVTLDAGTEVFNKGYLLESLDASFAQSRVQGKPCSVIYFDLDFFKKVNDTHGHSCGDFILREAAQLAKSCMRSEDVVGRYGGEEFVVVLSDCDVRLAAALAERLRKAMESHDFVYGGKSLKQTVSIGVSEIRSDFASPRELLDNADQKLYQSKHSGRNRVTV